MLPDSGGRCPCHEANKAVPGTPARPLVRIWGWDTVIRYRPPVPSRLYVVSGLYRNGQGPFAPPLRAPVDRFCLMEWAQEGRSHPACTPLPNQARLDFPGKTGPRQNAGEVQEEFYHCRSMPLPLGEVNAAPACHPAPLTLHNNGNVPKRDVGSGVCPPVAPPSAHPLSPP